MSRPVTFLVDGFNVYHSLKDAARRGLKTRWLDLASLFSSYLYLIGGGATLGGIHYFSALAYHREASHPGTVSAHSDYIDALENTGVTIELARFKEKQVLCPHCRMWHTRHEEKETDVAIAVKLMEVVLVENAGDVVIVSGDTDLLPVIRAIRRLRPTCRVWIAFPSLKHNVDLANAVGRQYAFKIKASHYQRHQFLPVVQLRDGRTIRKPSRW